MFKFKIFNEFNKECENLWKRLEKSSSNDFFQTYDYHKELVINNDINRLNIVVILENDKPVLLFPFFIKEFLFFRILQFIGTKYSDYCNPLVDSEFYSCLNRESFHSIWKDILNEIKQVDFVFLNNQLKKIDNYKNPVVHYLKSVKFSNIFRIQLKENFNEYKNDILKINKKYHYEIHRTLLKKEKLEKNHYLKFEIKSIDESDLTLDKLITSKIAFFSQKKKNINLNKKFAKIFANLNKKSENFFISTLKIDNKISAACFSIRFNKIFYYFIPVILSKEYEKYKIGKILILDLIQWCLKKDIEIFDFGLGAEKYKKYFSNLNLDLFRCYYYKNLKGFFLFIFLKTISFFGFKKF